MKKSWSIKGFRDTTQELIDEKKIKIYDKGQIDLLVDAFNRHPWRAAFFVWSTINANARNDFRKWNKDEFIKFYTEGAGIGCFEKVVAWFLQQGFKKKEVLPVDTWVGAFHKHTLSTHNIPCKPSFS